MLDFARGLTFVELDTLDGVIAAHVGPASYTYPVTATLNAVVDVPRLSRDAIAAAFGAMLDISTPGSNVVLRFDVPLDAAGVAALDALIAAHTGAVLSPKGRLIATSKLCDGTVILGPVWAYIGETSSSIAAALPSGNVARALGRLLGSVQTTGAGAELRLVEARDGAADVVLGSAVLVDTAGAWSRTSWGTTGIPNGALCSYRLEGQLGSATAASVRAWAVTLLERSS